MQNHPRHLGAVRFFYRGSRVGRSSRLVGLATSAIASAQPNARLWLMTWILAAVLALLITVWSTARKARRLGIPLLSGAGRKFTIGMAPSLMVGIILLGA